MLIIKSLMLSIFLFSVVGCKSSSNGNRVTTNRSKQKVTSPKTNTNQDKTQRGSDPKSEVASSPAVCGEYSKKMLELGWENAILETNEAAQKIKVSYFVKKNSNLGNPVLVLPHVQGRISNELASAISDAAEKNSFDPIIMEPRGTGCSSELPINKKEWNNFTADKVAEDAELLRKKLLNDKPWKVWSHKESSLIALKMLEKNPESVVSVHMADFVIASTPVETEKNKLLVQIDTWKKFKEFSKSKGFELTDDVEQKIKQTLLLKNACSDEQQICKLDLLTSLIDFLSGDDSQWSEAVKIVKQLSEGNISEELNQIAKANQKVYLYNQLLIAAHVDSDEYLTACEKALNDSELNSDIKTTPIISCRIDQALKKSYLSSLRGQVQHKKLDFNLIQKNTKESKIDIHLALAERSLTMPLESFDVFMKNLTGESQRDLLLTPESGTDLFLYPQLLETLM